MYTTICTFFSNAFTKTTESALFRNKTNLKQQQKPIVNSLIIILTFLLNRQVQCGNNTECQATCGADETGVCDHHSKCHCHHSHTYVHITHLVYG